MQREGYTMKNSIVLFMGLFCLLFYPVQAQEQTTDGGYVFGGTTMSYTTDTGGYWSDIIVYKVNGSGAVSWFDHYGGLMWEEGTAVRQTSDGGYMVLGHSDSFSFPHSSAVLFKLDTAGTVQWRSVCGIEEYTFGWDTRQTADGGYVIVGATFPDYGTADAFVVKLDAAGNKQWQKTFGGSSWDFAAVVDQTTDGGYIIAGGSRSFTHGQEDFLLYKLGATGGKQWRKNYGGVSHDTCLSVQQTADGGYIAAGSSASYTHGPSGFLMGDVDFLVYKLDGAGKKQWRKNYGGWMPDFCMSVNQTADGGYILGGDTVSYIHGSSFGFPYMPHDTDLLVYKIDAAGNKQWRKNYGGILPEYGGIVLPTTDGGYFLYGDTASYVHGDNSGWPHGPYDVDLLIYKLDSAGNKLWRKNYGGTLPEWVLDD